MGKTPLHQLERRNSEAIIRIRSTKAVSGDSPNKHCNPLQNLTKSRLPWWLRQ